MKERFGRISTNIYEASDTVSFTYHCNASVTESFDTRSMDDLLDLEYAVKRSIRKLREYHE